MSVYGDAIHEHSRHPRNYGSLDAPDIRGEEFNPLCGDRVRIELNVDAHGVVSAARFQGDLCIIAKAAGSILTEMITGRTLADIESLTDAAMLEAMQAEIRPARVQCALLALMALRKGIADQK
ncbi:MAG TPA: iron-sulfur cluster assembly scaffold protein [Thermoanaerobaculia bacterium]|nr:iron-sulfur cluster assembly scaffold protein [Thermoanaerobaculia bacterium]